MTFQVSTTKNLSLEGKTNQKKMSLGDAQKS